MRYARHGKKHHGLDLLYLKYLVTAKNRLCLWHEAMMELSSFDINKQLTDKTNISTLDITLSEMQLRVKLLSWNHWQAQKRLQKFSQNPLVEYVGNMDVCKHAIP